uniref:TIL domain containing protein n=1 Tax=Rhipicephalus zambeziensis TaxID=60191 RepID=A0A224YFI8_9ACAR
MRLSKVLAAVILVLLVVSATHAWPRSASFQTSSHDAVTVEERVLGLCEGREKHKECQSSNCAEMTCGQLLGKQPKNPPCRKDCVTGCFCRKGFYRHKNDTCATAAECRKS